VFVIRPLADDWAGRTDVFLNQESDVATRFSATGDEMGAQ
jgi:hypothetical protein